MDTSNPVLTPVQAARRIYNTPEPTPEQVGRVVAKIEAGAIARSQRGGATTTLSAVVEYLVTRESARTTAHSGRPREQVKALHDDLGGSKVSVFYRGMLREYFRAVLLRKRSSELSRGMRLVVGSTHVVLLLALAAFFAFMGHRALVLARPSAEQVAATEWLSQRYQELTVHEVRTVSKEPKQIQVQFTYWVNKRKIDSKMLMTLESGRIASVSQTESATGE